MKGNKILAGLLALLLVISLTACGRLSSQGVDTPVSAETASQENAAADESELLTLEEIPDKYLESSDKPGQVVRIDYKSNTYNE